MANDVEGLASLSRKLSELGDAAAGKALRSALMTASLPALRNIQAAAPVGSKAHRTYKGRIVAPGFLRRNIRRKSLLAKDKSRAIVLIGPAQEAFYAQFIERGKKGYAPHPFMEQAFESSQHAVLDRFKARLAELIDRAKR